MIEDGAPALDVRSGEQFALAMFPVRSILRSRGQFATWAGTIVGINARPS